MIHKLPKAARKRHPGWNFSGSDCVDFSEVESPESAGFWVLISRLGSSMTDCVEGVDMVREFSTGKSHDVETVLDWHRDSA